jgi:hypothetical protein
LNNTPISSEGEPPSQSELHSATGDDAVRATIPQFGDGHTTDTKRTAGAFLRAVNGEESVERDTGSYERLPADTDKAPP